MTVHGARWRVQPVVVEGDTVAWALGRVDEGRDALAETIDAIVWDRHELARDEADELARAETIDAIVWDLLRADDAARAAAIDRAADLELDLDGPLRVVLCELGPAPPGTTERAGSALRQAITARSRAFASRACARWRCRARRSRSSPRTKRSTQSSASRSGSRWVRARRSKAAS